MFVYKIIYQQFSSLTRFLLPIDFIFCCSSCSEISGSLIIEVFDLIASGFRGLIGFSLIEFCWGDWGDWGDWIGGGNLGNWGNCRGDWGICWGCWLRGGGGSFWSFSFDSHSWTLADSSFI